jgi:hypothetical protein
MEFRIPSGRSAPVIARATVSAAVPGLDAETAYVLRLLTSELVSDAVVHGADPLADVILRLDCESDNRIFVEVLKSGDGFDPVVPLRPSSANGDSLFLVDQLATRWGIDTAGSRTKVWFQLEAADGASRRRAAVPA